MKPPTAPNKAPTTPFYTEMKHNDSTESLTRLQEVSEARCCFCQAYEDVEKGRLLIHSKQFSACGCVFSTHLFCWKLYLESTGDTKGICPLCRESISTLSSRNRVPSQPITQGRLPYQSMRHIKWIVLGSFILSFIVSIIVCIYIFVINR
jgi:hypothetical protein